MIKPEDIKRMHQEAQIPYRMVWQQFGWSEAWYKKMLAGEFKDPNPKRLSKAVAFLKFAMKQREQLRKHTF